MFFFSGSYGKRMAFGMVAAVAYASTVNATMDPRFELDTQTLDRSQSALKSTRKHEKRTTRKRIGISGTANDQGRVYTVKRGDHLFKILMREYGLSNDEAESFVEEIRRENNINDIRHLKVGQRIIIPPVHRKSAQKLNLKQQLQDSPAPTNTDHGAAVVSGQAFRLDSTVSTLSSQEATALVKETWEKLLPSKGESQKPFTIQSPTFSLTLDSQRFPMFATMDGARILLDQDAAIPPLVKALIQEKDPKVRIVSESPDNGRRFLAAMLGSAGFYSVE